MGNLIKMGPYTLQSTVKNGQLIIDLPMNFNNQDVEIVISPIPKSDEKIQRDYLNLMPNKRAFDAVDRYRSASWGGDDFVKMPTENIDWDALQGVAHEPKMTADDIDNLVKTWRTEWTNNI